ncbi:MAG: anti-sigma factor domain-containing protein [Gammaproteobacteria bacterium]
MDRTAREDLMTRYVLGDLGPSEAEEFERLLAAHPEWAGEVGRLRRALDLMPYATATPPPPHLRARVLHAAQAARRPEIVRAPVRVPWRWVFAATAAVLLVAVGVDDYRLRRELTLWQDASIVLQQPNVVLPFALRGTGASLGVSGSVLLDLDAEKAGLVIHGLDTLPEDQVYRLWAEVGDKKVPCGQFNASADGTVVIQFPIPVDAYTAPISRLIVTRELANAPLEPLGPVVMLSS